MGSPQGAPMGPPQGHSGPASPPRANPGLEADALTKVRGAVSILQEALPHLSIGGEPHKAVLSAIQGLSKVSPASASPPGVQQTMLQGMMQKAQQQPMLQQLMKFQGGPPQPGAGGGGAPPPSMMQPGM